MFLLIFSGSARSLLVTFGAEQYKLPDQTEQYQQFYFIHMFFIKIGALIGRFIGPVLREDVKCLNMNHCYPLAFGMPAIIMLTGLLIFICARSTLTMKQPTGNTFIKVFYCIFYALFLKIKYKNFKKEHWLDLSKEKFGRELVEATKTILRVFAVFVGISIYWSCFMQQNSRWVYQASQMNGDLGFYTLKPDQIIMLNPLTSLIMTPICRNYVFPLLDKLGFKSLLHRMTIGGFLCIISFIFCIVVEIFIQENYISMLWLIPQYIFSAISEIFVFISLVNFAYDEAPGNMKSIMNGLVYLSIAFGIAIISIVSGSHIFASQVYEFTFFVCLLFVNMLGFIILSKKYKSTKEVNQVDSN
jgi:solute carrier family 15 (oligopeptide transporter), member 1